MYNISLQAASVFSFELMTGMLTSKLSPSSTFIGLEVKKLYPSQNVMVLFSKHNTT